jgi:mxaD protein
MKNQVKQLMAMLVLLPVVAIAANAPPRHTVEEKIVINADPATVWAAVKDFNSFHVWHPAVKATESTGPNEKGTQRTLTLEDGNTITEELQVFKEEGMTYKYAIKAMSSVGTVDDHGETLEIPVIPVNKYISFVTVKAVDGGSEVIWKAKFYRAYHGHHDVPEALGDDAAVNAVTAVYQAGLTNLKSMLEK